MPDLLSNSTLDDLARSRLVANAPWLVKLRWVAAVGQLATILFVEFWLAIALPLVPLGMALATTAVTNVALSLWLRGLAGGETVATSHRRGSLVVAGVMLLDLVVLTGMLFVTGGATNPFIVFYLVNLALAGVLLEPFLAWLLEGVAIVGVAILYWHHWQVPVLQDPARLRAFSSTSEPALAAVGNLVAFVACSGVIVLFMTRLSSELQQSEVARRQAEERRARSEKFEALGTLAAGAAHELATPLSTIAVVATEVERELASRDLPPEVGEDLALVRSELQRCRKILDRMAVDSGQMIREAAATITLGELAENVLGELAERSRVSLCATPDAREAQLRLPITSVAQALRGLVQNALDASPHPPVTVQLAATTQHARLTVIDQGPGMPSDVLARAGEPFFTTKEPGQGMGLGLFLARSVVERVGGTLHLDSTPGQGTKVQVELPRTG